MPACLRIYINTSNDSLVAGQDSGSPVEALELPLFYGDTLTVNIYLLQTPVGYNAQDTTRSRLETVSTAGLQLFLYISDGLVDGTVYTDIVEFTTDDNDTYFIGNLPLNTPALKTLVQATDPNAASAYLKIGYIQDGLPTTILSKQISIGVGIPNDVGPVAPGQTPISAEVANATYIPKEPVAGQPIYLESPNGHIFVLRVVDNPDGTASFEASQMT